MSMKPTELQEKLKGVLVVMVTPFREDFELNEEGVKKNTRFLINNGIKRDMGVLIPSGGSGECSVLNKEERKKVFKIVVEEAKNEVPVVACCNHTDTREIIELAKYAQNIGADGIMLLPPYYGKPLEDVVVRFYETIAHEIEIGIVVYNNPPINQLDIPVDTMKKLAEIENVVGLKECTHDFVKFERMVRHLQDKIAVLNGCAEHCEPYSYMMGTPGFITGIANFAPKILVELHEAALEKNWDKAKQLHLDLCPFLDFSAKNPGKGITMIKEVMNIIGLPAGPVRLGLPLLNKEDIRELKEILDNLSITKIQ